MKRQKHVEYNFQVILNYFPGRQKILIWVMPILGSIYTKIHHFHSALSKQSYSSDITDSGGTSGTQNI